MDRTLFTPPMIETFRSCRRAYELAFASGNKESGVKLSALCKRFLIKALAEIHRGRINGVPQVQKFLGQHWPVDKIGNNLPLPQQDESVQAFRFVYRVLTNYIENPYCPQQAEIAAVDLKVRARIPHSKVYLEDTFDLVLWHKDKRHIEFVDFHLHPLKPFDPAWPSASLLVKQFLAERLRSRWPFETASLTFCQLSPDRLTINSVDLDETVYALHWPELLSTVERMKNPDDYTDEPDHLCRKCQLFLEWSHPSVISSQVREPVSRSA